MSQLEKLRALLTEMGVEFREVPVGNVEIEGVNHSEVLDIECEQGMRKVLGYGGFATYFRFDKEGSLLFMGAYE